jgi:hypothetical protein
MTVINQKCICLYEPAALAPGQPFVTYPLTLLCQVIVGPSHWAAANNKVMSK